MVSENLLLESCTVLIARMHNEGLAEAANDLLTSRIDEEGCFEVIDVYEYDGEVHVKVEISIPGFSQSEIITCAPNLSLGDAISNISLYCEEQRMRFLDEDRRALEESNWFKTATPKDRRDAAGIAD